MIGQARGGLSQMLDSFRVSMKFTLTAQLKVLLTLVTLLWPIGCQTPTKPVSIIGSWELLQMSRTPVPVDQLHSSESVGGIVEFKLDKTYSGELKLPGSPTKVRMNGAYVLEDGILTLENKENGSIMKSKLHIQNDILTMEPINNEVFSFAFQYRRVK